MWYYPNQGGKKKKGKRVRPSGKKQGKWGKKMDNTINKPQTSTEQDGTSDNGDV